jgi:hypothetical protein
VAKINLHKAFTTQALTIFLSTDLGECQRWWHTAQPPSPVLRQ